MNSKSILDRLGGEAAVDAAINIFYDKLLSDDRVKHLFENVYMTILREHQKAFLKHAFGGDSEYTGKSLREAHKHLVKEKGLNKEHFQAVAENLEETLKELNVPKELIDEIMTLVANTRDDVLGL